MGLALALRIAGPLTTLLTALPAQQDAAPHAGGKGLDAAEPVFVLLDELFQHANFRRPFVRVRISRALVPGSPAPVTRYGFLLGEDATSFQVRFVDGDSCDLAKSGGEAPGAAANECEPAELDRYAESVVARLRQVRTPAVLFGFPTPAAPLPIDVHALVVAHACARAGYRDPARKVWDALPAHLLTPYGFVHHGATARSFSILCTLACGDRSLPWSDVLRRHETWLALFAESEMASNMRQQRDLIAGHVQRTARRVRTEPPKIADLVAELSETEDPPAVAQAEAGELLLPFRDRGLRTRAALVALAQAAIPALIDGLAEDAPSRSLSYSTKYGGTFELRPRSELICGTLREIVGPRAARLWTRQEWLQWWQAEKADRANPSGR